MSRVALAASVWQWQIEKEMSNKTADSAESREVHWTGIIGQETKWNSRMGRGRVQSGTQ